MESVKLVRRVLLFTLALSLLANIGHTLLADSVVPVWLRMIGAVAWPLLVFFGVDITVKVAWDAISGRRGGIWVARLLILVPGVPAGITSYEHMHAVLLAMGERPFIAAIGPGAVDLMMIGCTITLVLLQRSASTALSEAEQPVPVLAPAEQVQAITADHHAYAEKMRESDPTWRAPWEQERKVHQPSRPRAAKAEQAEAIRLMLAGKGDQAIEQELIGASTLRRYERAERRLREGAPYDAAECSKEKVKPELIEQIREGLAARIGDTRFGVSAEAPEVA